MLEIAQPSVDPDLGIIPHGARVDEHDVGRSQRVGLLITGARQDAQHNLAIGHVHLAAVGFNVDLSLAHGSLKKIKIGMKI